MKCNLCPRKCNADREKQEGVCRMPWDIYAARAALHMWEEPCISGENGSGAVFFTGCTLRCVFCQNHEIAAGKRGQKIDESHLAEIFLKLQQQKANNINLVTPTQYVLPIIAAVKKAKAQGLKIPVVYNTSGYERVETLRALEGLVDIYLPDMKYSDAALAGKLSGAPDYPEVAKSAIAEMVRQCGKVVFDAENVYIRQGVIVRHMLLPEHLLEAEKIVRYLYETYENQIYISMMSQYTPIGDIGVKFPELGNRVRRKLYRRLIDYAVNLGVEQAFYQEGEVAKESFIPEFYKE